MSRDQQPVPRPVAPREYYSIGEACELTGLEAHVLRYWEQKFPELSPSKNRSGNRVYQRKEIRLILLVKRLLYDDKYTIEGARARLEEIRRGGTLDNEGREALDAETLRGLRADLHELSGLLRHDAGG
ncbi:MAG: MerR family transcriptional regulator [Gemmatimonadota bacterium]